MSRLRVLPSCIRRMNNCRFERCTELPTWQHLAALEHGRACYFSVFFASLCVSKHAMSVCCVSCMVGLCHGQDLCLRRPVQ